mgnify:CR=1 FL=1
MTPGEFSLHLDGYGRRQERETRRVASQTAALMNCWITGKRLTADDLMGKPQLTLDQFGSVEEFQQYLDEQRKKRSAEEDG